MKNIIIKQGALGTKTAIVDGVEFKTKGLYIDMQDLLLAVLKEHRINVHVETREGKLFDPITNKFIAC